jgi:hypothetical protein
MSTETILPNSEAANEVYDLLVSIGGADEGSRESFVMYSGEKEDSGSEWRFQGHFGFGGKFRTRWGCGKSEGDWFVNFYREDDTVERSGLVKILNEKLETLRRKHVP